MADEIKVEAVVDELSKPENKAELNKALTDAFNEATTPAEAKTAEAKPAETNGAEDKTPQGEDPSKKAGEVDNKKSRVEILLEDRNAAKTEAAEKQTEVQTLTKQVETLTALVEKLTTGKSGEANGVDNDDGADDKPMTKKEVDAYLEKKLQEKNSTAEQLAAAEKSITDQIQALEKNKQTPKAKEFSADIKAIMAKHPTLSAYAAYRMLQGEGIIPSEGVSNSNANRTGTGNRSKTNLLDNKKPEDMSQTEMLQYLKGAEKSGDLQGLI